MKQISVLILAAITLMNGKLIGNNDPIITKVEENKLIEESMIIEIKGAIQLYSVLKEEIELIDTEVISTVEEKEGSDWTLAYNRDYFIAFLDTKAEAITPRNFKRIAKKYFANTPELVARIGKKGFRYKNLPTIILYYNKQITQGKALTKEDKLEVKELEE